MDVLGQIIAANVVVSLISFVGLVTLFHKSFFSQKTIYLLVSFAAGVMLTTAFIDILPEAIEHLDPALALKSVLAGIVGSFIIEKLLWHHHHHGDTHGTHPTTLLVLIGDALHNFIDGIAIAASFIASPALGIATTIAIVAHEIPQELADFSILMHVGVKRNKALFLNFLSALTAIAGGLLGYFFLQQSEVYMPHILSIAGGVFIYIAAADLIPELHREQKQRNIASQLLPFLLGIAVITFVSGVFVHPH